MATRLYLGNDSAPTSPTLATLGWGITTSADRAKATRATTASVMASKQTANSSIVQTLLNRQFVSDELAAQTISGNFKGQIRGSESNGAMDGTAAIGIWVVKPDGSSRGTLLVITAAALAGSNEYTTSLVNHNHLVSTALSSLAVSDGDRLVIEIGCKQNGVSSNRNVSHSFGSDSGTDLPEDQTATAANNPWIEFANTLSFYVAPSSALLLAGD